MLLQIEESVYKKMCRELEQLNIANINLKIEINKSNEIKQGVNDSSRTTTNVLEKSKCVEKVSIDYQEGYYRKSEQIKELQEEVNKLKEALLKVALKL